MITQVERTEDTATTAGSGFTTANLGLALAAVAAVLGLWGGRTVSTEQVDGYGLLLALPPVYWIGVGLAITATLVLFRVAGREHSRYASLVPILWLLLLHAAPQLAHKHVRFPIVWTHIGLVRYIEENNTVDLLIDARFAWPGFFGTFVGPLAQLDSWIWESFARLWPAAITGGMAALVAALGRRSYPTVPHIGSLSALSFVLLAWAGQDYFSPQSAGYLWYVAILVVLESGPLRISSAWSASVPVLSRLATSGGDRPASRSTIAVVALIVLGFGAIVSHPVAPLFICLALAVLGLFGRGVAWRLLLLIGFAYALWFLVAAEPTWSAQANELLDPFGELTGNVDNGIDQRLVASPEHRLVNQVRVYLGLATFGSVLMVGLVMATDRFRHLRPAVPLVALAAVPVLALVLGTYGGGFVSQVLLFALPMASILTGRVVAAVQPRYLPIVAAGLAVALVPLFLIARFGNESFEYTTATDRAAIEAAYARAEDDTLFVADNGFISWRDRSIGRNDFVENRVEPSEAWLTEVRGLAQQLDRDRIIVVLTESQRGWRINGESDDPESLDRFADWLLTQEGTDLLYNEGRSWAIEL